MSQILLHPELRGLRPAELAGGNVVMFDLLRASTTIVHALDAGAVEVHAFRELDAARAAAPRLGALLAGERECVRPPDFDLGNSPAEMTARRLAGRTLAMTTSNGTRALLACERAERLFVGALANRHALARHLAPLEAPLHLLLAGRAERLGADDLLAAGALVDALHRAAPRDLDDGALTARELWRELGTDPDTRLAYLNATAAGQHLARLGMSADVAECARTDSHAVVVERAPPCDVEPIVLRAHPDSE